MPTFRPGQVVRVPFPYTDKNTRQHRPALVVSQGALGEAEALLWVVMITSAQNARWSNDIEVADYQAAGLPIPSLIRPTKIATIEARDAESVGEIDGVMLGKVMNAVHSILA